MSNINRRLYDIFSITGQQLLNTIPAQCQTPPTFDRYVRIPGSHGSSDIYITAETFSKHIFALFSIGSVKSTLLYHIVVGVLEWRNLQNRYIFLRCKG